MPSKITYTPAFLREAKKLAKKHRSLKQDLASLEQLLITAPHSGTQILQDIYKIRFAIKSKGKGKSGVGRAITFVFEHHHEADTTIVVLLSVYDKSEQASINENYLRDLASRFLSTYEEE
ncbi:MAG: hypothetical protein AAFZ52_18010 [Bacteroidota bacterium]